MDLQGRAYSTAASILIFVGEQSLPRSLMMQDLQLPAGLECGTWLRHEPAKRAAAKKQMLTPRLFMCVSPDLYEARSRFGADAATTAMHIVHQGSHRQLPSPPDRHKLRAQCLASL